MKVWDLLKFKHLTKIASLLTIVMSTGCAGAFKHINTGPPRAAYTFLEKEIVYEVCIDAARLKRDINNNFQSEEANPTTAQELKPEIECKSFRRTASASGVHIKQYQMLHLY